MVNNINNLEIKKKLEELKQKFERYEEQINDHSLSNELRVELLKDLDELYYLGILDFKIYNKCKRSISYENNVDLELINREIDRFNQESKKEQEKYDIPEYYRSYMNEVIKRNKALLSKHTEKEPVESSRIIM